MGGAALCMRRPAVFAGGVVIVALLAGVWRTINAIDALFYQCVTTAICYVSLAKAQAN
mgnify:CR=1 FL=1